MLFLCAALLIGMGGSFTAEAQTKPRLAILPFTGGGSDGDTIAQLLGNQAELRQVFTTVARTGNVEAIMREQRFQRTGLTDSDTIAELGRQLNADYVVAGHIQTLGARKLVLITVIHVESLRQVAGVYREYGELGEVRALLPEMVQRITAASRNINTRLPGLAVLPFDVPEGVNRDDAEVLAQLLATEIANGGKYAVLPRTSAIQSVMTEQGIQRSGLTDPASTRAIGEALNAGYVLAGSVAGLGDMNLFIAQILSIEGADLVEGGDVEYRAIADGLTLMTELAVLLTPSVPPPPPETIPLR
jgi:TolB-like protein